MPRTCSICGSPDRAAIDAAIVAGEAYRSIAKRFDLSAAAVFRHRAEHIPTTLARAKEAGDVALADDLLGQVRDLQGRTLAILTAAEGGEDYPMALRAIGEARRNLELLAKLTGELDERPVVNVLVSPQWLTLRGQIVAALAPYPEARYALAGVLDTGVADARAR